MIGKFASASALLLGILTIFTAGQALAQTSAGEPAPSATVPAGQTPAAQSQSTKSSAADEPADEESTSRHRSRVHNYKNWTYDVGFGANIDSGTTKSFVRGGGGVGTVGVARNANKYLGLRADFIFANLPLRDSALQLAQATSATDYALAFTIDPVINIPVTSLWGGYVLFGPGYYHRSGSLHSDTTVPGSFCSPFWKWWGNCSTASSLSISNGFVDTSQNQLGYNFGGGITRKMPSGVEIYVEYRFVHGSGNNTTTDFRPITLGVRW